MANGENPPRGEVGEPSSHYRAPDEESRHTLSREGAPHESALLYVSEQDTLALGEPPAERKAPKVRKPHKAAAGIPAIVSTMKYGFREMGVFRSLRTFTSVNQERGFDCQSCAWPSPDKKRKVAEFCENGAKAIADELTHKRVDPEFFAAHSIDTLLAMSDYEINAAGRLTHPMMKAPGATHFTPVSWDEAFALIGNEMQGARQPE